jgi:hypothetical protein
MTPDDHHYAKLSAIAYSPDAIAQYQALGYRAAQLHRDSY